MTKQAASFIFHFTLPELFKFRKFTLLKRSLLTFKLQHNITKTKISISHFRLLMSNAVVTNLILTIHT